MSELLDLSIVIPAYNEETRIIPTLNKLLEYAQKKIGSYEIIIVDDGSTDSTVRQIQEFNKHIPKVKLLQNEFNIGKGKTVKRVFWLPTESESISRMQIYRHQWKKLKNS